MSEDTVTPLDPEVFGDRSPCFGCAPHHPVGLKLRFERRGDEVHTRWTPGEAYQGPPGILHGGLVTTVADELAAWTVVGLRGCMGFTAELGGRLGAPARVGTELKGVGRITRDRSRIVEIEVVLSQGETTVFEGRFTFALLDEKGAERLLGQPLPEEWKRFCRGAARR